MILNIKGVECIIDDDDYERIGKLCWHIHKKKWAFATNRFYFLHSFPRENKGNPRVVYMHRYILSQNANNGKEVDHINGNTLDNRKCNLRICSRSDNCKNIKRQSRNKSGYKGVTWDKENNKWRAYIQSNKKRYDLGRYVNIIDAYKAYCEASAKYHGEYGRLE